MDRPPDAPRRTRLRGDARRQAILDAAVRLFGQRGFRSTGIVALADDVGLTHAGVLHHFGTKENLLHALVARREVVERSATERILSAKGIALFEALPMLAEQLLRDPVYARLFSVLIAENFDPGEPLHDYFVARSRHIRGLAAQAVLDGQASGDIALDVDPQLIANEVLAFIVGMQNQWLLDPDDFRLTETFVSYTSGLLRRLRVA